MANGTPPDDLSQKTYEFGELNPVEPSFVQKRLNTKTMDPLRAMREAALKEFTPDAVGSTGPYKGIVLMVLANPEAANQPPNNWLSMFMSNDGDATLPTLARYKIRIPEIHAMLPEPMQYATGPTDEGEHVQIINRYPTFISSDQQVSEEQIAGPGDLVWVDFGNRTNMTDPVYLGKVFNVGKPAGSDTSSTDPHSSPCGKIGNSPAGGKLSPDQRSALSASGENFGNAIYLPKSETKKRNKASPSWHVLNNRKQLKHAANQAAWMQSGGSGNSISGKIGPGSCSTIENRCARILMAQRLIAEDNADRGYMLGGKSIDAGIGGIDCSGFVLNVRVGAEYLCSADGNYFGLPDRKNGDKWHEPTYAHSSWQYNTGQHKNIMGSKAKIYDGTVPIMPGDEICMAKKTGPTAGFASKRFWRVNGTEYKHGVSHVVIAITDPDGYLRIAESGGPHTGVGALRFEEWWDRTGRRKNLYVWQCKEMDAAWDSVNGRPTEPWTPELARKLVPELFDKKLNDRATGKTETSSPEVSGKKTEKSKQLKTEEQKKAEEEAKTEGKSEDEKKRVDEAKAKLPKLEEELKALEEKQELAKKEGKDDPDYVAKKKEYDETKAIADGKKSNTKASDGAGQTPSNESPSPASCSAGNSGQVGGTGGGNSPTNSTGKAANPPTPPPKPPAVSDVQDAKAVPKYNPTFLGALDHRTYKKMLGYDFIAIHDGGSWIWAGNNSAKHPLTGETVPAGDASATAGGLIKLFQTKSGSYHYYIGLDGTIFHLISEKLGSYASGCWSQDVKTRWGKTIPTCSFLKANKRSISISLRNPGKGKAYTEEQHTSVKNLLQDISRRRGIPLDDNHVVAHFEIKKYNHFDPVSGGKAASGKDSKNWWNWVSLGSNFNYDHAKENYGNQYPHKVTG